MSKPLPQTISKRTKGTSRILAAQSLKNRFTVHGFSPFPEYFDALWITNNPGTVARANGGVTNRLNIWSSGVNCERGRVAKGANAPPPSVCFSFFLFFFLPPVKHARVDSSCKTPGPGFTLGYTPRPFHDTFPSLLNNVPVTFQHAFLDTRAGLWILIKRWRRLEYYYGSLVSKLNAWNKRLGR